MSAPPTADGPHAAAPFLSAALTILSTLEREVRAAATPGSAYEVSANALSLRCTELQSQLTRIEFEKRNETLMAQLDGNQNFASNSRSLSTIRSTRGGHDPEAVKKISALTGKLVQAESDCKAYKARLRQQEVQMGEVRELKAREADLERRLLAAEAATASKTKELEELRRRAVVAEASCDALRDEMEQGVKGSTGGRHHEGELLQRIAELEREVQSLALSKATHERKAEICEAELVDSLARVYKLEADRDNGYGVHAAGGALAGGSVGLTDDETQLLERCLLHARDEAEESWRGGSGSALEAEWSAADWMDEQLRFGEPLAGVLLHRLRGRGGGSSGTWRPERAFVGALGAKGGRALVRALLLEGGVVDAVCETVWRGIDALADEDVKLARMAEARRLQVAARQEAAAGDGDDAGRGSSGGDGTSHEFAGGDFGSLAVAAALAQQQAHPIAPTYFEADASACQPYPLNSAQSASSSSSPPPQHLGQPQQQRQPLPTQERIAAVPLAPMQNLAEQGTDLIQTNVGYGGDFALIEREQGREIGRKQAAYIPPQPSVTSGQDGHLAQGTVLSWAEGPSASVGARRALEPSLRRDDSADAFGYN